MATLWAAAWLCLAEGPAWAGSIKGTVLLSGPVPEPRTQPVTIDQYVCGQQTSVDDLVVGPKRGIRSAVVSLQTPPQGARPEAVPVTVQMDQRQCAFVPRVVVVPVGGTVEFLNSDRLLHNLHSVSRENPSFNRTQPQGRSIPVVFRKPEIVRVDCELHAWMRAWVVVAEHPFYAVTAPSGEFTLDNVPPGRHTLQVWHETLGTLTRDVTVAETGVTTVTIELGRK